MRAFYVLLFVAVLSIGTGRTFAQDALKVGDELKKVELKDEEGKDVDLTAHKGKNGIVIFFYPKADTPGCTKEACGFRDDVKTFQDKGYVVYGASRDLPEAQKAFKEKFKLTYSLLSDPKSELAGQFGFKPGARMTAVIGKDGKIEGLHTGAGSEAHAKDIATKLK